MTASSKNLEKLLLVIRSTVAGDNAAAVLLFRAACAFSDRRYINQAVTNDKDAIGLIQTLKVLTD